MSPLDNRGHAQSLEESANILASAHALDPRRAVFIDSLLQDVTSRVHAAGGSLTKEEFQEIFPESPKPWFERRDDESGVGDDVNVQNENANRPVWYH